jgi:hypothetical protein
LDAAVYVRLGREVHCRVTVPDERLYELPVPDVPSHELMPLLAAEIFDVVQVTGVSELV